MNSRHLRWIVAGAMLLWGAAWGQDSPPPLHQLHWQQPPAAGGEVVTADLGAGPESVLRIVHDGAEPLTLTLWTIEPTHLHQPQWYLEGRVAHRGVAGSGFLELRNYFGPQTWYFTRTLATTGPLQALAGDAPGRSFALPFYNTQGGPQAQKLVVNLVLPGAGTVDIGPLTLYQGDYFAQGARNAWWSERQAGLIGGVGGALLGCFSGLLGTLAGLGKARRFTLGAFNGLLGASALIALLGGYALASGQPWWVYYPLLLGGGVVVSVLGLNHRTIHQRYLQRELRQIQVKDHAPKV